MFAGLLLFWLIGIAIKTLLLTMASPFEFSDSDYTILTVEIGDTQAGRSQETQYDLPPMKKEDKETQSSNTAEIEVQTDTLAEIQQMQSELASGGKQQKPKDAGLSQFLTAVYPFMSDQLTRNSQSNYFEDYIRTLEGTEAYSISRTVSYSHEILDATGAPSLYPCSDCAWNCTGSVLAVSYGRANHDGWCEHRGPMLAVWNVMKRRNLYTRADIEVEMASCLLCIEFHPELPTILAGGLFNGEIRVWDTDSPNDEPLLMSSTVDDYFHREPIAKVTWTRKLLNERLGRGGDMKARLIDAYHLVSIGGDGKVLFWTMENKLMHPTMGAIILPSPKYFGHGASQNKFPVLGGAAIDFSSKDSTIFVVGTEIGGVLKSKFKPDSYTSVASRAQLLNGIMVVKDGEFNWTIEALAMVNNTEANVRADVKRHVEKYCKVEALNVIQLENVFASRPPPLKLFGEACNFAFEPHAGPVYAIHFSPFHRNLLLTCSTDGSIKLFNMYKSQPLLRLVPTQGYFFDVQWSPARPLVFAAADGDGMVYVYDLMSDMLNPVISIQVPLAPPVAGDSVSRAASIIPQGVSSKELPRVTAIAFNKKDPSTLATVGMAGFVHNWQLSQNLCSLQSGEQDLLNIMGAGEADGENPN